MDSDLVKTSKFLSFVLRHHPESIGLPLDSAGWADVDDLIRLANASGRRLDRELVFLVVETSDKQRFALDEARTRIRANQGHSIEVDLGLSPRTPPPVLFHGTALRFLESIRSSGLVPGTRTHVHLSQDRSTARAVGARHGKPVVLSIDAAAMHAFGSEFRLAHNGVWLVAQVSVRFITFPRP
ncbi:MAG TPA: RNA 2'-phosphotransferase [Polyangiaceae bacterium]